MKRFIVTTTINAPTLALQAFDEMAGCHLVVAGDQRTPKDFELTNGTYLSPDDQEKLGFDCLKMVPWNVIQRRNAATLFALREGAEQIAFVDDDNMPYDGWATAMFEPLGQSCSIDVIDSFTAVDPLYEKCRKDCKLPRMWHRGFPVQMLSSRSMQRRMPDTSITLGVVAGLWNGEPDVDAMCRIANGPFDVSFESDVFAVSKSCFSPFNTQNTAMFASLAMLMCLPFGIGRMDDIWASYIVERIMRRDMLFTPLHVMYGPATVYQKRNKHDLLRDLGDEMLGYANTYALLNALSEIDISYMSSIAAYELIVRELMKLPFVPQCMTQFQAAWINDVKRLKNVA